MRTKIVYRGEAYDLYVNDALVSSHRTYGEAEKELFRICKSDR